MPADPAVVPIRPRRRRLLTVVVAGLVAAPLSLLLAGSGRAAPTLTIPEAEAQISALQTQEDAAVEAYDQGRIASAKAAAQAARAAADVRTQTDRLQAMYAGIRSFAVATYTGGSLDSIDVILGGANPQVAIRKAGALDEIARSHQRQLVAIHAQQVTLTAAQHTAAAQAAQAAAKVRDLAAAKDHIQNLIGQQQAVLAHLQEQQREQLLAQQRAAQAAALAAAKAAAEQQAALARQQQAARLAVVPAAAAAPAAVSAVPARPSAPSPGAASVVPSGGNAGLIALRWAETQRGKPYVWGAAGPNAYDCSGLVMAAFAQAGISLPHSAADQYGYGTHVPVSQLQPGDIVFYNEGGVIGHDGIYVGGGKMIDANHTGGWVDIRGLYSGLIGGTRI